MWNDPDFEKSQGLGKSAQIKAKPVRLPNVCLPPAQSQVSDMDLVRNAYGVSQAIVKVASYAKNKRDVSALLRYISRDGELELEMRDTSLLSGLESQKELLNDWSVDFGDRKNGRVSVHIVFSMPPGSEVEALRKTVRQVADKAFEGYDYVFGIHQDRKHPHIHMAVKMRGVDPKKKLRIDPRDLYALRSEYAQVARGNGVMMGASPRFTRGEWKKTPNLTAWHMKERGLELEVLEKLKKEVVADFEAGNIQMKPWEVAMQERHVLEQEKYLELAKTYRQRAETSTIEERKGFLHIAGRLEEYGNALKPPKSRRQELIEVLESYVKAKTQDSNKGLER